MKPSHFVTTVFFGVLFALPQVSGASPAEQPTMEKSSVTAEPANGVNKHETSEDESAFKTQDEKINYAIGVQLIGNFKRQGIDIDFDAVTRGMRDALSGSPLLIPDGELRKLIMTYQEQAIRNLANTRRAEAEANKKQGFAFLEENKSKEGVVTLDSGVQIIRIKDGDGPKPTQSDTVACTYRGTLIDGTEFDRSPEDGKPVAKKVNSMLPGVQEAVKLMPVGSAWKIVIPAHLGYGPRGNGSKVGPHSVLIYELELHEILQQ